MKGHQELLAKESSSGDKVLASVKWKYYANHLPTSASESPEVFVENDDF